MAGSLAGVFTAMSQGLTYKRVEDNPLDAAVQALQRVDQFPQIMENSSDERAALREGVYEPVIVALKKEGGERLEQANADGSKEELRFRLGFRVAGENYYLYRDPDGAGFVAFNQAEWLKQWQIGNNAADESKEMDRFTKERLWEDASIPQMWLGDFSAEEVANSGLVRPLSPVSEPVPKVDVEEAPASEAPRGDNCHQNAAMGNVVCSPPPKP